MFRIQNHPTGFKKITLLSLFGYKIRIHYWPNGASSCKPDIHGHRWPFLSFPLLGTFIETRYQRRTGDTYELLHCYSEPLKGPRPVVSVTRGDVEQYMQKTRTMFRPYICPAEAIHSYQPIGSKKSITIVITGRPRCEFAEVWREEKHSA